MMNDECGMKGVELRRRRLLPFCILHCAFCIWLPGCTQQAEPAQPASGIRQRQEKALRDPFNYSPEFENTDISGGRLGDFDEEGMQRDLKNVFDP